MCTVTLFVYEYVGFLIVKVNLLSMQNPVKCSAWLLCFWNVLTVIGEVLQDFPSDFKPYCASIAEKAITTSTSFPIN
jgi:hypothetical protein